MNKERTLLERIDGFNLEDMYPLERVEIAQEQDRKIEDETRKYLRKIREILGVKTKITQPALDNVMIMAHTVLVTPYKIGGKVVVTGTPNGMTSMYG